jgi:hypothetical protein
LRGSHLETLLSSPEPLADGAAVSAPWTLPAYGASVAELR